MITINLIFSNRKFFCMCSMKSFSKAKIHKPSLSDNLFEMLLLLHSLLFVERRLFFSFVLINCVSESNHCLYWINGRKILTENMTQLIFRISQTTRQYASQNSYTDQNCRNVLKFSDRRVLAKGVDPFWEEQSDEGLPCLSLRVQLLNSSLYGRATLFKSKDNYSNFSGVQILRNFTGNGPKFSDRNSVDLDQTAPRGTVWSRSTLFAIPSASFGHITQC